VSSLDQRVDRQLDGITVQRTFTDTVSGARQDAVTLDMNSAPMRVTRTERLSWFEPLFGSR
jgi:hypothetical protein